MDATKPYCVRIPGMPDWYVDPVAMRRELLRHSHSALWAIAAKVNSLQRELRDTQDTQLPADLEPSADAAAAQQLFASSQEALVCSLRLQIAEHEAQLAAVAFKAFGLDPIDPQTGVGYTEAVALAVLHDFMEYAEKKD